LPPAIRPRLYEEGEQPPRSEKYFENAPKFKSSPQNNGKSTGFLKQMLCGARAWSKYLSKYNLKI
jgi:hypothetical protein